jgi:hypothetical protein
MNTMNRTRRLAGEKNGRRPEINANPNARLIWEGLASEFRILSRFAIILIICILLVNKERANP